MYLAAKLLAKAQATPYDAEAMSLVRRSCLILMRVVTESDGESAGPGPNALSGARPRRDVGRAVDWQPVDDPASSEGHVDLTA